jgi:environmental stress-induced protein Ves
VRLLRASDHKAAAWKNGRGTTREIAAFPPGAGYDDFGWRVSMASVASSGSFSIFAGFDRVLTVLSGSMSLLAVGRDPIVMNSSSDPFAFPGDLGIHARLSDGPVEDVNVMTRRGQFNASVARVPIRGDDTDQPITIDPTLICLCESGFVELVLGNQVQRLERFDAAIFDRTDIGSMTTRAPHEATLLVIRIRACQD